MSDVAFRPRKTKHSWFAHRAMRQLDTARRAPAKKNRNVAVFLRRGQETSCRQPAATAGPAAPPSHAWFMHLNPEPLPASARRPVALSGRSRRPRERQSPRDPAWEGEPPGAPHRKFAGVVLACYRPLPCDRDAPIFQLPQLHVLTRLLPDRYDKHDYPYQKENNRPLRRERRDPILWNK
jgi:hypothetical protein